MPLPSDTLDAIQWNQVLENKLVSYQMMKFLNTEIASPVNSMTWYFRAYNLITGTNDGTEPITIADFNPQDIKIIKQIITADEAYSGNCKVYNKMLNDKFFNPSTFVAILNDIDFMIIRPMAQKMLQTFITHFEAELVARDAEKIEIGNTASTIKDDIIKIRNTIKMLQIANPKYEITDGTETLFIENSLKEAETILFMNSGFVSNYNVNLASGTFNKDDLNLPKNTTITDFDIETEITNYAPSGTAPNALKLKGVIMSKNLFIKLTHYEGDTYVKTVRLYDVYTKYVKASFHTKKGEYFIPIYEKATT